MNSNYKVTFSSDAEKVLFKLDKPTARRIFKALELLAADPYHHANTKKMKGYEGEHYRLRMGNFRIIFEIMNNELIIFVIRIGPRGDVYK